MKTRSLRWRILLPPLIILFFSAIFLSVTIPRLLNQFQTQVLEDRLITEVQVISTSIGEEWANSSEPPDFQHLAEEWANQLGGEVVLLSLDGSIWGTSGDSSSFISPYREEFLSAAENGTGSFVSSEEGLPPTLYLASQIGFDESPVGFVHLSYTIPTFSQQTGKIRNTLLISFGIFALMTLFPLIRVTTQSGLRLQEITSASNKIAEGNLDIQIPIGPRDEIGASAYAINQLALRLKEQFQKLEVEQAKINAVLLHMNEGVMILDSQGRIMVTNHAALELFKIEHTPIIEQRIIRVIRYHQIHDLWQAYSESGKDQAELIELSDQNKLIQVTLTPLDESVHGHSLIVFQDLTQIRQLQTIRRDFISNISHELRTPLASLKALAETLQISALDDPDAARRFLARMDTEIEALAQMVSELLELSRIESGQVPLHLQKTEANKILASVIERLAVQAERAKLSLKAKFTEEPNFILADTPRLEQVLVNIIHNAIKFTPSQGKIRCSIQTDDEWVIFKIKDNGEGIPQEDLPRIFERFYKSRRPNAKSGTGLGLSIAKHLVEAHGGNIWVESQLDHGTTFHLAFPRQF